VLSRQKVGLYGRGPCDLPRELLLLFLQLGTERLDLSAHRQPRKCPVECCLELATVERFAKVIVCAMTKGRNRHLFRAIRGGEDDGYIKVLRANRVEHIDAGHAGHRDVEKYQIGIHFAQRDQTLLAARSKGHLVAARFKARQQQSMNLGIVVDHEHAGNERLLRKIGGGRDEACPASDL
jgi:hypothetical protein